MKKYGILAALVMSFALTGCGGENKRKWLPRKQWLTP